MFLAKMAQLMYEIGNANFQWTIAIAFVRMSGTTP